MEVIERHSGNNALGTIFDCAYGYLNFSDMLFGGGGVHKTILYHLIYSVVKIHVHEDSLYYHATSGISFINHFKDLLNCLDIWVGTFSTVTNFITRHMVINKGAPFTNITSVTRFTNLCNFKTSLGTST